MVVIGEHNSRTAVDGLADERLGHIVLVPHSVLPVAVSREAGREDLALVAEESAF